MAAAAQRIDVIERPETAAAMLHPTRLRLLRELEEPASATEVAGRIGLPRQKANYHLRELEKAGLVRLVEERRKGNCIERIVRATASSYIINPDVLGALGETPEEARDAFSASYLIACAARMIRDVATLRRRAKAVNKRLATFTADVAVRFASAADQHAFTEELAQCVAQLSSKYHSEEAPGGSGGSGGRSFRFTVTGYPEITKTEAEAAAEARAASSADARKEQSND